MSRHTARILAIGDELLLGRTVDTNSAFLARWCADRGLTVTGVQILGDDEATLVAAIKAAASASDLVLVTGGLGPTEDDRTRHALAGAMGAKLEASARAWNQIERYWGKLRPGPVPVSNKRQALMPVGARVLKNDRGTAPGMLGQVQGAWIACMPGVPHEMFAMAERLSTQLPRLIPGLRVPEVGEVHFAGLGESSAQDQLGALLSPGPVQVGITAHELGHITVRVVGSATAVRKRCAAVRNILKPYLLPEAGLAPSLVAVLTKRGQTITSAESCTCGAIAGMLGAVPGCSAVLQEALVAYHNEVKAGYLGVSAVDLKRHGAVSEQVVAQMARGALARSGASLALATSGIAGPDGGTRAKPVGTVWMAAALGSRVVTRHSHIRGDRSRVQQRAAASALLLGWQLLTGAV
ncbi:MAG: nicotinamide-nucleotide amidohydrolase family protein [Planctomycetota bacterium]|jgi:nicotinamide-nucleotide amidase|nr:nicotinamide-nucleotide amidohydrolase family protein [Planctomycetota bacterium]